MNITKLMHDLHNASNESEIEIVTEKIKRQFSSLSDSDKELVKIEFLKLWDEKLDEAKSVLNRIDDKTSLRVA